MEFYNKIQEPSSGSASLLSELIKGYKQMINSFYLLKKIHLISNRANILLLLTIFIIPDISHACFFTASDHTHSLNIDLGNIVVKNDTDTPVGGVIASKEETAGYGEFSCGKTGDSGSATVPMLIDGDGTKTVNAIYKTNIDGIGMKIYYHTSSAYGDEPTEEQQAYLTFPVTIDKKGVSIYNNDHGEIRVELIKTVPISQASSGALSFSRSGALYIDDSTTSLDLMNLNVSGNITIVGCSENSSTPSAISMSTAYSSDFQGPGSTAKPTNFSISLSCNGSVNPYISFAAEEEAGAPGVIKNDATDGATGVGIQLLYNNTPVTFNNEISVGQASTGEFDIPLTAQYYKTQNTVTSGDVHAVTTYTITYQ